MATYKLQLVFPKIDYTEKNHDKWNARIMEIPGFEIKELIATGFQHQTRSGMGFEYLIEFNDNADSPRLILEALAAKTNTDIDFAYSSLSDTPDKSQGKIRRYKITESLNVESEMIEIQKSATYELRLSFANEDYSDHRAAGLQRSIAQYPLFKEAHSWLSTHAYYDNMKGWALTFLVRGETPEAFLDSFAKAEKGLTAQYSYIGRLGTSLLGYGSISDGKVEPDAHATAEDDPNSYTLVALDYTCPMHRSGAMKVQNRVCGQCKLREEIKVDISPDWYFDFVHKIQLGRHQVTDTPGSIFWLTPPDGTRAIRVSDALMKSFEMSAALWANTESIVSKGWQSHEADPFGKLNDKSWQENTMVQRK